MIPIPRASFGAREGGLLKFLLWASGVVFVAIMVVAWIAAERAAPVLLELETGQPVARRAR